MTTSRVSSPSPELDVPYSRPGPGGSGFRGRLRRLTKKKVLAGVTAIVVLTAVGGGTAWLTGGHSSSASATGAPVVTTSSENVKVTTGTMTQTISASGTLEPAKDSDLTFDVSGTVTAVDVIVGEKVTAGQTLATIGSAALADQVASDKATLTSDEDQLTTAEDDSASTSSTDSDETQITAAETQLTTAETDLSDAALVATFSGTIASVDLAVGDSVSGGGSTGSAGGTQSTSDSSSSSSSSDGITVISTDSYTISTSVDDTEVSEVKVGDAATITPSDSSTTLHGTVASVSLIASSSSDSDVAEFPVVIDVTGTPTGIYPGASATVDIVIKQLDNVVEVPTAAISYSSGQATVTEVSAGSRKTVDVATGTTLDDETQITSGLRAGDTIVEEVTTFKTAGGTTRSLFGGTGTSGRTGAGSGGFPGTGSTGGPPGGGNFSGGGSFSGGGGS